MVVELLLTGVVLVGHTLVAAVMTRYFRIRMTTSWGAVLYTLFFVPLALLVTTYAAGLALPPVGGPVVVVAVLIGIPLVLGVTIDVLYVTPPEEYDLPEAR